MPKYIVNGKTYNIPDDKVDGFENKYPNATVEYHNGDKTYQIPLNKRDGFLKQFPQATTSMPTMEVEEQPIAVTRPSRVEQPLEQPHTDSIRPMQQPRVITSTAAPNNEEYVEGFGAGFKQGWKGLKEGVRYFAGETANIFTGSSLDDAGALEHWEQLEQNGQEVAQPLLSRRERKHHEFMQGDGWDAIPMTIGEDGKPRRLTEEEKQAHRDTLKIDEYNQLIHDAIEEAGGDLTKAKQLLSSRAADKSWGDKVMESASEEMSQMKPTKGFGAWVGNLVPQMIPSAAAMVLSYATKNPKYAKMVGGIGMGTMTVSTAGQSMKEARDAGASTGQVWAVGIADGAIEYATEKIPFDNYTKRLFNGTKKQMGKELADAVVDANSPARNELEKLLTEANKKLGGKLLNGRNVKDYATSILAEGASEFTAEALQTITPMIYENPEDYPTINEILQNGWEGAKAGLFMGAALGGASKSIEHQQQRSRRQQQGFVDVAQVKVKDDGTAEIGEVVGVNSDNGNLSMLIDGEIKEFAPESVMERHRFSFEEFDKGVMQMEEDESYDNGYSLEQPQEMNDAKNEYEYQQQNMRRIFGFAEDADVDAEIGNPIERAMSMKQAGVQTEEVQAVLDYANAKATFEGMLQHQRDDIESRTNASNEMIDSRVSQNDGMIHPALMNVDDRRVYVVSGNLVMNDDNTMIDRENSDESIVVRDAETGKLEFTDPASILRVEPSIDPASEKEVLSQQITEEFAQQAANKIDGVLSFQPNEQYTLTDEQGVQHTATIVMDNGDNTVALLWDNEAEPTIAEKEVVQQMHEATNLVRLQQFEQQRAAERIAFAEAEREAQRPMYNLNDHITIRTDSGMVRGQITSNANEDGMYEVYTEQPIRGKARVAQFSRDELDSMVVEHNGGVTEMVEQPQPTAEPVQQTLPIEQPAQVVEQQQQAEQQQQVEEPVSALARIPVDAQGNQEFEKAPVQDSWAALVEMNEGDTNEALDTAQQMLSIAQKELDKALKQKAKGGTTVAEIQQNKAIQKAKVKHLQSKVAYWTGVAGFQAEQKRIAEALAKAEKREKMRQARAAQEKVGRYSKEDAQLGDYLDFRDYVMRVIATGAVKFKWGDNSNGTKGLGSHLGLKGSRSEMSRRIWLLNNESGDYPEVAAEGLLQGYSEFVGGEGYAEDITGMTTMDAFNEMLDVVQSYDSPRSMFEAAQGRHTDIAEAQASEYADMEEYARAEAQATSMGMSVNDWLMYEEMMQEIVLPELDNVTDNELLAIFADAYDAVNTANYERGRENNQIQSGVSEREGLAGGDADGNSVLPNQQPDYTGAGGQSNAGGAHGNDVAGQPSVVDVPTPVVSATEPATVADGTGLEQNNDEQRQADGSRVVESATPKMGGGIDRGDIRVLEEGLDATYGKYLSDSERTRRDKESERLVAVAKQNGLFIPLEQTKTLGTKYAKRTGESAVYVNEEAGKVFKVKNPYAKSAMKSGVQPEDAIFEHTIHNLLFPETAYTFEGISEDLGDVRFVLSQQLIRTTKQPTQQQIVDALASRGLVAEDKYSFGNDLVSVTDVEGDNVLLGENGELYFIDPIIKFKKPAREIVDALTTQSQPSISQQIEQAEQDTNIEPTEAQKEAGNYKKGHIKIDGFDITIETPKGVERSGVDEQGNKWSVKMNNTYGYIRGTEGVDGDHIDLFLSDNIDNWNGSVYVIDQVKPDGSFDEHKVMYGFNSIEEAQQAYLANYSIGWQGLGAITGTTKEEFQKWVASSHRKTKPFAEYKSVKSTEGQSVEQPKYGKYQQFHDEFIEGLNAKKFIPNISQIRTNIRQLKKKIKALESGMAMNVSSDEEFAKVQAAVDDATDQLNAYNDILDSINKQMREAERQAAIDRIDDAIKRIDEYQAKQHDDNAPISMAEMIEHHSEERNDIETLSKQYEEAYREYYKYPVQGSGTNASTAPIAVIERVRYYGSRLQDALKEQFKSEHKGLVERSNAVKKHLSDIRSNIQAQTVFASFGKDLVSEDGKYNIRISKIDGARRVVTADLNTESIGGEGLELSFDEMANILHHNNWVEAQHNQEESTKPQSGNKLVTDERYEELKARMKSKLSGQMNMGIDPEILAIGTEMAVYHIEKGARKFIEYAKAMIGDMGDAIRPYLKAFYNGARELPEVDAAGYTSEMTPYDEVRAFDVANFDKSSHDAMATAEIVVKEQEVAHQAEQATQSIKNNRNNARKNRKKVVPSQQVMADLFGSPIADEQQTTTDYDTQRGSETEDTPMGGYVRGVLDMLREEIITGKEDTDFIEALERGIEKRAAEDEAMRQREGKPFAFDKELRDAEAKVAEYTDLMKKELAEKEAKYAERGTEEEIDLSEFSSDDVDTDEDKDRHRMNDDDNNARERVSLSALHEFSRELGVSPLVVFNLNDIENAKKRNSKGWYDTKTGEVVIVLPNATSDADIKETILHEVVAHKGLRKLVGKDHFEEFLDKVFRGADKDTRAKIVALATKNGWNFRVATEEYMAGLAEQGFDSKSSFWSKVRKFFVDMFRRAKISIGTKLNDNDLRYMLWRSYQMQKSKGAMAVAEDVDMQRRLGVGNFRARQVSEEEQIVALAKKNGSYLKAPNGKPTNLSPKQWAQVRTKAFKEWFGDWENDPKNASKVVDENGEPKVVYNGSKVQHYQYDGRLRTKGQSATNSKVSFFTDSKAVAERYGKFVNEVFLNIRNPYEVDYKGAGWQGWSGADDGMQRMSTDSYADLLANGSVDSTLERIIENYGRAEADHLASGSVRNDNIAPDGVIAYEVADPMRSTLYIVRNAEAKDMSRNSVTPKGVETFTKLGKASLLFDSQIKSATDNVGLFGKDNDDIRYRRGSVAPPSSGVARHKYNEAVRTPNKSGSVKKLDNMAHRLQEAYQDSMLSLRELYSAILEETGNDLHDFEDAYKAENRMSSENKAQAEIYMRDYYKPLQDAVRGLIEEGAEYNDIVRYMIAKHGLERNEVFSKRDAEKDGGTWDGEVKRDYSGLTELTQDPDNFTDLAQEMVDEFEKVHDTSVFWDRVNAATKETLRKSYESGLMQKDTYEKVRDMFEYYIPLRGWDANVAANEYEYLTSNRLMLSPTLKTAQGRSSIADDPLATIGYMAESAIAQGNRNLMKQKFLNFVLNNPTSLATVSEQWYVKNDATGVWIPHNPDIPEDATADEVAAIVEQHEKDMEALGNNATKERTGLKLGLHATKWEGQQHTIRVSRNGKEYLIFINGNPTAAMAINGLTNPNSELNSVEKAAMWVKNFMARAFTSQNPAFIFTNLSRDVIWAGTAVAIKEDKKYTAQYTKNISGALLKGMLPRLIHKFQKGTLDTNVEIERYFEEFIRNGGETGFTQINTVEDYKRNMKRFIEEAQGGKVTIAKKAWRGLWDSVEFLNRSAEDTTRFMVYMTSRQMGRSVSQSVWDAKEVTVNFNKKGRGTLGASVMNFAYIFFNATIQGLMNFGRLMYKHPVKTTLALSSFTTAGFIAPMLAVAMQAMLGDDDDERNGYWDLPEWVRRNNIVLYLPWSDNGFITIPLPHEVRPFYGMGELAYSCLMGKETVENALSKAVQGFASLLPLDYTGNAGNMAVNLTPTILQPIEQLKANKDYFGKPIYRKNDYNKRRPEWTKAYKGTNGFLVSGTKWLNEVTGGDNVKSGMIDINPAIVEHIFESYLGGVGKTVNKTIKTFSMLWDKDAREWRNVPVVSSFYQEADERTSGSQLNREYFEAVDEAEATGDLFSGYKQQLKMGSMEYAEKLDSLISSPIFQRYKTVNGYQKAITKLNNALKMTTPEEREELETTIMELKAEMLDELKRQDESNK